MSLASRPTISLSSGDGCRQTGRRPIINDALMEDAMKSGLDEVAMIVSSGWDGPGVSLKSCSEEFLDHYKEADLIISKGQGNYETLSGGQRPTFHLLKAKCPVIAENLGVKQGDTVIKYAIAETPI